jgi:hypothetical protein
VEEYFFISTLFVIRFYCDFFRVSILKDLTRNQSLAYSVVINAELERKEHSSILQLQSEVGWKKKELTR